MTWKILQGDCLELLATLPDASVQTCVTSPPYWGLRDYGADGQLGLEPTPAAYVEAMVSVFREVRRVLRDDGTLWLNLGDSYSNIGKSGGYTSGKHAAGLQGTPCNLLHQTSSRVSGGRIEGLKPKDMVGIPWRVAFALQADGWYLRSDIIWAKPNPMPSSVMDRPTGAHEYLFLLAKGERYYYNADAIAEPAVSTPKRATDMRRGSSAMRGHAALRPRGKNEEQDDRRRAGFNSRWDKAEAAGAVKATRNRRTVWTVAPRPFKGAHFATMPPDLVEPCVLAGAPVGGVVLDPFSGAGTTGVVAARLGREYIGIELNPEYVEMSRRRIERDAPLFNLASGE